MKTDFRKMLACLLTLCMVFSMVPQLAFAQDSGVVPEVASTIPYLTALSVGGQTLSPAFNRDITEYELTVPNDVESINVSYTAIDGATDEVIGTPNALALGENKITVRTSMGGSVYLNYTITVTREGAETPTTADLASFTLDFNGAIRDGTINADATIAVAAESHEEINNLMVAYATVNEETTLEDAEGNLIESGVTRLDFTNDVVLTAKNGDVSKSYTIKVTREGDASENYELRYATAEAGYNVGETISYDIFARTRTVDSLANAHALDIGSYEFTAGYESDYLTYASYTSAFGGEQEVNTATDDKVTIGFVATNAAAVPYYANGTDYVGYVKLGTVTYTVNNTIPEAATLLTAFEIDETAVLEVTPNGYSLNSANATAAFATENVYVHNNIATFNNNHTTGLEDTKAYLKYDEAGMWTANDYETAFTVPNIQPVAGYRKAADTAEEPLWLVKDADGAEIGKYVTADLASTDFITATQRKNLTITPITYWLVNVTYEAGENGEISGTTSYTYDDGMKLTDNTMPTPAPNPGYKFIGWSETADADDLIDLETYTIGAAPTAAKTITAMFADEEYVWSVYNDASDHVTVNDLMGVDTSASNKIVHGTQITFTLSSDDAAQYEITKVEYTVGNVGEKIELTANEGVYTIGGALIIGDITLYVTTQHFHTITYVQGTGIADTAFRYTDGTTVPVLDREGNQVLDDEGQPMVEPVEKTASVLYVKSGEAGLYADKACSVAVTLRKPQPVTAEETATERYVASSDIFGDANHYSFYVGETKYYTYLEDNTTSMLAGASFTADIAVTSHAVLQYKVNFEIGAGGTGVGANFGTENTGTEEEPIITPIKRTFLWYDLGTVLTADNTPAVTIDPGYTDEEHGWTPAFENVTETTTYTYTVTDDEYDIIFRETNAVTYGTFTNINGVGDTVTEPANSVRYTVSHSTTNDVTFKVTDNAGYVMRTISCVIGGNYVPATEVAPAHMEGGTNYTLTADGNGVYTIDGDLIIGNIYVLPTYDEYVTVSFAADEGATFAEGAVTTAYAKKGVVGLYTSTDFDTAFTYPTVTAKENYRFYDTSEVAAYWTLGGGTPTYVDTAAIGTNSFTENVTFTATTVKTVTLTFAAPVNGTLNELPTAPASITVDDGTTLGTIEGFPVAAANEGFAFTGWQITDGALLTMGDGGTFANHVPTWKATGSYEFTAVFTALDFLWLAPSLENATIDDTYPTGVDWKLEGTNDDTVTYGTPITFKLTAAAGYVIRADGVRYTVGGTDKGVLTADGSGLYTIPGNVILGDVQISVTGTQYRTITFQADEGKNTLTTATAYAVNGVAGLYATLDDLKSSETTTFTVPVPVAASGYRLAKDTAGGEELWITNESKLLTSTGAANEMYTSDTTLTARSVKTWNVTFAHDANGTLNGTVSITVDDEHFLTAEEIPTPVHNSGYQFDKWTWNERTNNAQSLVNQEITADITYTAEFVHGTYDITFNGGSVAVFTPGAGVTGTEGAYKVTNPVDASFTVAQNAGKRITNVKYSVADGVSNVSLGVAAGTYIIPGANVVGDITVTVESVDTYTVTFVSGGNGTVSGTTQFVIDKNGTLSQEQFDSVVTEDATGYEFTEWRLTDLDGSPITEAQILAATVTADVTYMAYFHSPARTITDVDSVVSEYTQGYTDNKAYYNYDVVFTTTVEKVVTSVSYKVQDPQTDAWGEATLLTANADGSYTILGTAITGDIQIHATTLNDGQPGGTNISMEFILRSEYKAIVAETYGRKILVLNGTSAADSYSLKDGTELYWSPKYNAHVCWVADTETAATLAPGLVRTADTPATAIAYDGDINASSVVTAADAGIINDCLHDQRLVPTSAMQLFKLDVEGTGSGAYLGTNSWKYVSTSDITWTLKTAVGTND